MFDRDKPSQIVFTKATRETPDRVANILIWQAFAFTALIFFLICFALIFSESEWKQWAGWLGLFAEIGIFILVILYKGATQTKETIDGPDIEANRPTEINRFEYHATERSLQLAELPAPKDVIRDWCITALNGGSLSYSSWQKRFATRPNFSDGADRYRTFRAALVSAEWATEQGTHSISLTEKGERGFEDWLVRNPEPTPLLEG